MPVHVIAICGARRVGKDTVADYLCENHGFVKASFAAPLKDMVRAAFGFSQLQVDGPLKDTIDPVHGITPRQALQFIGTDIMQYEIHRLLPRIGPHDRTFWAERLVREHIVSTTANSTTNSTTCDADDPIKRIVISDMRFPHEQRTLVEAVQREGGVYHSWRVTRRLKKDDGVDAHTSEVELQTIPVDAELHNDDDVKSLYMCIDACVRDCKKC